MVSSSVLRFNYRQEKLREKYGCDPFCLKRFPFPRQPHSELFSQWLDENIGYKIRDPALIRDALMLSGGRKENRMNFQRLEFLGDAIANLFVTKLEGEAGTLRPMLRLGKGGPSELDIVCSNKVFSRAVRKLGLMRFVEGSDLKNFGNEADLLEAITGALYLDSHSYELATKFFEYAISTVKTARAVLDRARACPQNPSPPSVSNSDNSKAFGLKSIEYEALGHRVHRLLTVEALYRARPTLDEGGLTRLTMEHSKIVLSKVNSLNAFELGEAKELKGLSTRTFFRALGELILDQGYGPVKGKFMHLYASEPEAPPPSPLHFSAVVKLVA